MSTNTNTPSTTTPAAADEKVTAPAKPVKAPAPRKAPAAKTKPAAKVTTAKAKAPAKAPAAKTTKPAAEKAAPKPATSSAPKGHPGHTWLALMTKKGLSQTGVATTMGVAPMTLNRLVNGHGIPTAKVTVLFARAVEADVNEVWNEVAKYELTLALAAAPKVTTKK